MSWIGRFHRRDPGDTARFADARLDRLARVKEVAQIGAVIGREFSYELLAYVVPLPISSFARP